MWRCDEGKEAGIDDSQSGLRLRGDRFSMLNETKHEMVLLKIIVIVRKSLSTAF